MRVSGWRQQRLLAVAAVLADGGTGAGVAAWSRYAKLTVVQTQDKAEMRAERHKGRRRRRTGGGRRRRRRDRLRLPVAAGYRALERRARAGTCTRLRREREEGGDGVVVMEEVVEEVRCGARSEGREGKVSRLLQCRRYHVDCREQKPAARLSVRKGDKPTRGPPSTAMTPQAMRTVALQVHTVCTVCICVAILLLHV